ncbi:MAG: hypothetical protein R3255_10455 [Candidatus Lokiarchaeia archaeon]|nr:hypothetical protein [Candidatus Lokiarchaeia archaeon]
MSVSWEIGREARELDTKPIKERLRIERRSIKRIGYAIIFYSIIMFIFYIFL